MKNDSRRGWNAERQRNIANLLAKRELVQAAQLCQGWLEKAPNDPELLHQSGIIQEQLGKHQEAYALLQKALKLSPRSADLCNNLGIVLESLKDYPAAEAAYNNALKINPHHAETHGNLSTLLLKLERPTEALPHARLALRAQPHNALHWIAAGDALQITGNLKEAAEALEHAVQSKNPPRRAYTSLARIYFSMRREKDAIAVLQKAHADLGDDPLILNDLAMALGVMKRYEEAQPLFEQAYRKLGETVTLYNVIQNLARMKRWDALFALEDEVLRHPQPNAAITALFGAAASTCNWDLIDRLMPAFLEWFEKDESDKIAVAIQNLLYLMPRVEIAPDRIKTIIERVAANTRRHYSHSMPHFDYAPADCNTGKLRIGYLSGDFRLHAVNIFFSGLLSHYDKAYFEVYCYSNLSAQNEDEISAQYRRAVDAFVDVSGMTDIDLAREIHEDGIHILIDLSGYTAASRLGVMFYRPAPMQACYLGYPFTTGLTEIDYYLADPWLNGPQNPQHFTEQILEIPESFVTSGEHSIYPRPVVPPVSRNGFVTFGSLSNCYKINREVIAAWSRILKGVPSSRLILNHPNYSEQMTRETVLGEFERHGVDASRINLRWERHPDGSHLYWYEEIDLALDTFPLTGGTTTFEALWMGVPMVTRIGDVYYERLSYSFLMNCGVDLRGLIAEDEEGFVENAIALARDHARVEGMREALWSAVPRSLLCDASRHVRLYEGALIDGWNRKFPVRPKFTPSEFSYSQLNTPASPLVATVPMPGDLHHFVVLEQGRWFAPEYALLHRIAPHVKGVAVEVGNEPGFFTLEMAHLGLSSVSLATSAVAGRLIKAAAAQGGVEDKVQVWLESASSGMLDRLKLADNVGIVRIGVEANDGQAGVLERNPEFWAAQTPLVLLSVHASGEVDLSVAEQLSARGYTLYKLVPGLEVFAVYEQGQPLDSYTLYLFACSADRVGELMDAGLLIKGGEQLENKTLMALDQAVQATNAAVMLDDWVIARAMEASDSAKPVSQRFASLQHAIEVQHALLQGFPSLTRRLTLARLLVDVGRRAEAVAHLSQALAEIEQGSTDITMPFLAPSRAWDDITPEDRLAEWLFASILETRCRLAAHSTFFLSSVDVKQLELLSSVGFDTDFSRRVLSLQEMIAHQ